MRLLAEMTPDFAFTRTHTLSMPIRFDVMSSLVLHVSYNVYRTNQRNGDTHGVRTTQVVS